MLHDDRMVGTGEEAEGIAERPGAVGGVFSGGIEDQGAKRERLCIDSSCAGSHGGEGDEDVSCVEPEETCACGVIVKAEERTVDSEEAFGDSEGFEWNDRWFGQWLYLCRYRRRAEKERGEQDDPTCFGFTAWHDAMLSHSL